MKSFDLEIVTPEGSVYHEGATQLSVMGIEGSLSVLAGHIPMMTALKKGKCRIYKEDGTILKGECSGGMLSVTKENVRLLCSYFDIQS